MLSIVFLSTSIIEFLMFIHIFNREKLVGMTQFVIVIYSIMPIAARIYDNEFTNIVSHVVIDDTNVVISYALFCFLYNVSFYLSFWLIMRNEKTHSKAYRLMKLPIYNQPLFYDFIKLIALAYLGINLFLNYGELSYFNQSAMKSNIIWAVLIEIAPIFIYIDCILITDKKTSSYKKIFTIISSISMIIITLVTCIKCGNRGSLIPPALGILYLVIDKYDAKISITSLKKWFKPTLVIVAIIGVSQFVRSNRGTVIEKYRFSFNQIFDFFDLKTFIYQDYTIPGNSLMYCMERNFVDPEVVIRSFIGNAIFVLDYPSVAEYLSKNYIAQGQWFGVGDFLPVESYMLCGWIGAVIFPFIIMLFFKLYYKMYLNSSEYKFKRFMFFVITIFVVAKLGRGQSYLLPKALYMYFLPSIILYRLQFGYNKEKSEMYENNRADTIQNENPKATSN